jgi:thiosulfate/3-mercaptopyruvate sulfurtransferase
MMPLRLLTLTALAGVCLLGQPQDPWSPPDLIQPEALVKALHAKTPPKVFYVGFPVLYRSVHIPGAMLVGPASKEAGIELLRTEFATLPKDAEVVLYCGCCPWDKCPNVRPAFKLAREMGLQKVKLVVIPTNLHIDWVTKGYPVQRSADAGQ